MGCRPRARSALHCHGVLALRDRSLSEALLAVLEGVRLVSRQFRKRRLALWAAGRGPNPHFTAMVFWPCETGLWAKLYVLAVLEGVRQFLRSSESDVWHYGLPAAGPIRTSLPWCFGPARPVFGRSFQHCQQSFAQRPVSQGQNTMAVKYGSGPRPAAHSAKRRFLNCLETIVSHLPALPVNNASLKHRSHRTKTLGSAVRIGPAAGSP